MHLEVARRREALQHHGRVRDRDACQVCVAVLEVGDDRGERRRVRRRGRPGPGRPAPPRCARTRRRRPPSRRPPRPRRRRRRAPGARPPTRTPPRATSRRRDLGQHVGGGVARIVAEHGRLDQPGEPPVGVRWGRLPRAADQAGKAAVLGDDALRCRRGPGRRDVARGSVRVGGALCGRQRRRRAGSRRRPAATRSSAPRRRWSPWPGNSPAGVRGGAASAAIS